MIWRTTSSSNVSSPGGSCQVGPSPSSRALRLEGLRATDPAALRSVISQLPDEPLDAALTVGEPIVDWLLQEGFQPYQETSTMVRSLEGFARSAQVPGVTIEAYRNAFADAFQTAEREALVDLSAFTELGQPTGYETAEGFDAFFVAIRDQRIVGFAQAQLPEGWVNWFGVVPDERRRGIGRALIQRVATAVTAARGTHIGAVSEERPEALAFWRALGFKNVSRQVTLIRRGGRA